jgi:hypothetical protein
MLHIRTCMLVKRDVHIVSYRDEYALALGGALLVQLDFAMHPFNAYMDNLALPNSA